MRRGWIVVKQLSENTAIVSSKELGTRCWLPKRFIKGERCDRVYLCNYPEKKTCQAVKAEIIYLMLEQTRLVNTYKNIDIRIAELTAMLEK